MNGFSDRLADLQRRFLTALDRRLAEMTAMLDAAADQRPAAPMTRA